MNLTPNTEKSTPIRQYYRCDAATIKELCQTNNQWSRGERDYPTARQYLADKLGLDMRPFQAIVEPYAHCDPVINILTQLDGSLKAEQARVRLAFAPLVLKEDGKFYSFTPDHFPINGEGDYHFEITASLVFDGKLDDGYQNGVVRSKLLADSGKASDDEVSRQTTAWGEVLTDLRYAQTDRRDPAVLFAHCRDCYSRDMIGERLYLTLSLELDLPWMIDNSRGLLEKLADNTDFQKLVAMKRAILDAKDMRSDKTRSDKPKPLATYGGSAASYSELFTGGSFADDVTSKSAVVEAAVQSLNQALEEQLRAAESECTDGVIAFHGRNNEDLNKFLQNI